MLIVDRARFLAMPAGTVYAKYEPCYFGELAIKGDTWPSPDKDPSRGDWLYQDIVDAIDYEPGTDCAAQRSLATGSSIPMDFDACSRDGLFEPGQLFAVFEPQDVASLIERLQRALADSGHRGHSGPASGSSAVAP